MTERCPWPRSTVVAVLVILATLLVHTAAAREFKQRPGTERSSFELHSENGKRGSQGTRHYGIKQTIQGEGVRIMHRNAPSSPFRQSDSLTRQERMLDRLLRDTHRVSSINNRINQMTTTTTTASTFSHPSQMTATTTTTTTSSTFSHPSKLPSQQDFQAPVISGLSLGSGEYFIRVSVGTPPKSMYLVLDTGSDILWLQCAPCTYCYHQTDTVFDPSRSSSYSPLGCNSRLCLNLDVSGCSANKCLYQVDYGDGSFTTGEFATDAVSLNSTAGVGQVVLTKIPLGCGHDNEGYFVGAAGLLGLGKGPLAFPNQVDPQMGGRFSYCLMDRDTDSTEGSSLIFGDAAVPQTGAQIRFTPQASNSRVPTFYYLKMTGISVGGTLLTIPTNAFQLDSLGNGGVIIDSGTSVTRLQNAAYAALRDSFRSGTENLVATAGFSLFDTCYDLSGMASVDVPTVTLHFQGGADMKLPAANYLIPVDNSNTYCLAFAGTNGPSIIGNIQQQGYRVIYDNVHSQIGFVPRQCE